MSCMEHDCTRCDWHAMDNKPPAAWPQCPRCGARVSHVSDERDDAAREVADERDRLLDPWETEP